MPFISVAEEVRFSNRRYFLLDFPTFRRKVLSFLIFVMWRLGDLGGTLFWTFRLSRFPHFWEVVSFADSFCEVVPFADSFSFGGPLVRPFLCLSCSSLGRGPPNNCIVVRSLVSAEYGCNRRPSMGPSPLRPRWVSWTPLLIGLKGGWGLVGLLRGY